MAKKTSSPSRTVAGNREPLAGLRQRTHQTPRDGDIADDATPIAKKRARASKGKNAQETAPPARKKPTKAGKAPPADRKSRAQAVPAKGKKRGTAPQRSMSIGDLVPGPLPGESTTPRQPAIPRKIRV